MGRYFKCYIKNGIKNELFYLNVDAVDYVRKLEEKFYLGVNGKELGPIDENLIQNKKLNDFLMKLTKEDLE